MNEVFIVFVLRTARGYSQVQVLIDESSDGKFEVTCNNSDLTGTIDFELEPVVHMVETT